MRYFQWVYSLILLILAGCGGASNELGGVREGHGICSMNADCECDGGTPSCREGICYCEIKTVVTETEAVEVRVDGGTRTVMETETVEVEVPVDAGVRVVTETETVYTDAPSECYPLTRAEFIRNLMVELFYLGTYNPPDDASFTDVPPTHEDYLYIEAAYDQGVIGNVQEFRPDDLLVRAEAVKVMITAIDGLAGYDAPATPTFDDTLPNAWYFDYVEAAVQLGLVTGYFDSEGNLTGEFGPGDATDSCFTFIMLNSYNGPPITVVGPRFVNITNLGPFGDQEVSPSDTDVSLLNFTVESTVGVTVRDTYIAIGVAQPHPPGLEDANPLEYLTVKIADSATGATIAGPYHSPPSDIVMTEDYDFAANEARGISLEVDVSSDMPPGFQIQGQIRYSTYEGENSYFFDYAANEYLPVEEVNRAVNSVMTGSLFTVN